MKHNKLVFDLDSSPIPCLPDNMVIEQHLKQGQLELSSQEIFSYLSNKSTRAIIRAVEPGWIGTNSLNVNFLDSLLKHPEFIPENLEDRDYYFWGTIYRNQDGLYARVLAKRGKNFRQRWEFIASDWGKQVPASLSEPYLNYLK